MELWKSAKSILFFIALSVFLSFNTSGQTTAQRNKLERSLKATGYKVKAKTEVEPRDWEIERFGLKNKYRFTVKSIKSLPKTRNVFARYAVEIEVFAGKAEAENRLKRLLEVPPGFDTKMNAEYVLRDGFRRGNLVYIISTDAVMFADKSLRDLKAKLEKAL